MLEERTPGQMLNLWEGLEKVFGTRLALSGLCFQGLAASPAQYTKCQSSVTETTAGISAFPGHLRRKFLHLLLVFLCTSEKLPVLYISEMHLLQRECCLKPVAPREYCPDLQCATTFYSWASVAISLFAPCYAHQHPV